MPRTKFPPTPGTSTGPSPQDKSVDMEGTFTLPPAAINRSPPTSPVLQRKRTLSGSKKQDLPPPPSRARKIIQMKPKDDPQAAPVKAAGTSSSPKRKQPSATSAAGRKIARKTAHSIIERRRRSKMNEEFGVLKDMIPACNGVEMHKLAILQAGIEYVRYLQGCIEKLSNANGNAVHFEQPQSRNTAQEDNDDMSDASSVDEPRESFATSVNTSAYPSPALRPEESSNTHSQEQEAHRSRLNSISQPKTYSTSPPPLIVQTPAQTGISPAFNAIHFSPDLSRTLSHTQGQYPPYTKYSPNILPLPQAALSMSDSNGKEGQAEATATAALMMLTNDRRSTSGPSGRGGMSVRDLLSN